MRDTVVMIADPRPFFRAGLMDFLRNGEADDHLTIVECDPSDHRDGEIPLMSEDPPDVVILDLGHPHRSGLELARKIARSLPGTRLLLVSANPDEDDDELFEAIRAGAAGYLRSRGCSPDEFRETIARIAKGEHPINDVVASKPGVARRVLSRFQEMSYDLRKEDDIMSPLAPKELEILGLVAEGHQNKQIAVVQGVSEQTVKNHVSSILRKLHANDRAHAVVLGMRRGLVPLPQVPGTDRRRDAMIPGVATSEDACRN
jgi:DNA-binding NarL/FixJ family response regulator